MLSKTIDTHRNYMELLRVLDRRAASPIAAKPYTGELSVLGAPNHQKWRNHPDILRRALQSGYDELTVPVCYLGLAWFVAGCPIDKPYTLEQISEELVGIPWRIGASLLCMNDSCIAGWGDMASATRAWMLAHQTMPGGITARALMGDISKRMIALGATVKNQRWVEKCMASANLDDASAADMQDMILDVQGSVLAYELLAKAA
ncbi:MAG TPA: hypothetical protein VH519_08425 [Hyphomicrobiaceae bacterium]|jgi:hypothetical protein